MNGHGRYVSSYWVQTVQNRGYVTVLVQRIFYSGKNSSQSQEKMFIEVTNGRYPHNAIGFGLLTIVTI